MWGPPLGYFTPEFLKDVVARGFLFYHPTTRRFNLDPDGSGQQVSTDEAIRLDEIEAATRLAQEAPVNDIPVTSVVSGDTLPDTDEMSDDTFDPETSQPKPGDGGEAHRLCRLCGETWFLPQPPSGYCTKCKY